MEYINEKLIEFNNYLKGRKVAVIGFAISRKCVRYEERA